MSRTQRGVAKVLVFAACGAPFALLVLRALEWWGSLGPNPPQELLDTLGKTGLNVLLISLAISPLRRLTRFNSLIFFRRMLGLFSFFYVVMHFLTYAVLDLRLAWDTLFVDITQRPYITAGMTALVLMIPLAVTSTHGMQRRLKRNWLRLHRLVYPISVLAVLHFLWQSKLDITLETSIYALILIVLLGERVYRWTERKHRARKSARRISTP